MSIKEQVVSIIKKRMDTHDWHSDAEVYDELEGLLHEVEAIPDEQNNGTSFEAYVSKSYFGRKELFFNRQTSVLERFKDGQKVVITIIPNEDEPTVIERYAVLLEAAEKVFGRKLTNSNERDNILIRTFISYKLRGEGYSNGEIGRRMSRDHSSVTLMGRKMEDMLSVPESYKYEVEKYREFERALPDDDSTPSC